jgi:hypothetical protein
MNQEDLVRRLSALDLASESRVKRGLRARLLARGPRSAPSKAWPAAAVAVAVCLLLVLAPSLHHPPSPPPAPAAEALPAPKPEPDIFVTVKGGSPFRTVKGMPLFEERPIRIDELFVKPNLKGAS